MEQLASRLVESSVADCERIERYESDFTPANLDDLKLVYEIDQSIHGLYSQWIGEAEQVYARGRRLESEGHVIPKITDLGDAIGRTRARLKMTPESLIHALEQVKRGEVIPAKELRDELNARLRSGR